MLKELQEKLYQKYPEIFFQKDLSTSLMDMEITCGDGWYDLIDNLCNQILCHVKSHNSYIDFKIKQDPTTDENEKMDCPQAVQVKEKFGGLRFYTTGGDKYIDGVISMAESMSYCICEKCGNKGKKAQTKWILTLCDSCEADHKKRKFDSLKAE
jgi:hypothetical protein